MIKFGSLLILAFIFFGCDFYRGLGTYDVAGDYKNKESSYSLHLDKRGYFKLFKNKKSMQVGEYHYIEGKLIILLDNLFKEDITTVDYDMKERKIYFNTIKGKRYKFTQK